MTRFLSSKNKVTVLILWGLVVFFSVLLFLNLKTESLKSLPLVLLSLVIGTIVWILLDTRYVIKGQKLLYRSGPFRGNVDILKIEKIQAHSGFIVPVTTKPALNYKGFILTYDKNQEIYVSPKNHTIFLEELLKINSKIQLIGNLL